MIQIIGLLLCVYLVFKGLEILQIAMASPKEPKGAAVALGVLALIASVALGILFAWWLIEAGSQMSNQIPQFPR
jgi:high-affinity Fe2+/Pb2+ permease